MSPRFQAMVPVWDAVNHVTGQCNTRLHHCAESGALQMIATAHIGKGQQVCYKLLYRMGFLSSKERYRHYMSDKKHQHSTVPCTPWLEKQWTAVLCLLHRVSNMLV